MSITPKDKRNIISSDLEKIKNNDKDDFVSLRQNYIDLNYSLAIAYDYDKEKSKAYENEAKSTSELKDKQNERAIGQLDEDSGKKLLIPHKDDEHYQDKFIKENITLYRQLDSEYNKMEREAQLQQRILKTQDADKLKEYYIGLEEGQLDPKFNQKTGEITKQGKEINTERFRFNYPKATQKMEVAIERETNQEIKKENER
ncbi:hypothetical protein JJB27_03760 [Campylobacter fetus subsp. venerealis]|uniref:hypothetical protein n=1 Tax=Campylobacter fetus TaxID=196 RepID=UPI000818A76C|nr:hypothetical protein [Campylobacter fetus]MBK3498193.1 hypothetical protein [Campylobacter fetus subsp. venerealis]MBK3502176.1 hypothetical protein [Campylobacter fetus subsp. venerealis]OCS16827.1 hypothetical protein CfvWBT01109_01970 [Campylobacter fetus subsp. venerealis]